MNWYSAKLLYTVHSRKTDELLGGEESMMLFKAENWGDAEKRAISFDSINVDDDFRFGEVLAYYKLNRIMDIYFLDDEPGDAKDGLEVYWDGSFDAEEVREIIKKCERYNTVWRHVVL